MKLLKDQLVKIIFEDVVAGVGRIKKDFMPKSPVSTVEILKVFGSSKISPNLAPGDCIPIFNKNLTPLFCAVEEDEDDFDNDPPTSLNVNYCAKCPEGITEDDLV